jgi:hypothetical protein
MWWCAAFPILSFRRRNVETFVGALALLPLDFGAWFRRSSRDFEVGM